MHILGFLLAFNSAITLSNAQCYFEPTKGKAKKGCLKDGEMYAIGTSWYTKECLLCHCTYKYITCCNVAITPAVYDKQHCNSLFYSETCSYELIEKVNPHKHCDAESWMV
ncbi:PREDICTED: beta-microseminoprotein-like [Gavialis gangeticus]|uniref:beta-microseminoprotein-like n=1 Tax=Gavialis gangeticus TaxID=94835 RepID=UPI00092F1339|nr:PREDICTED: beta-microseminoprotein-like [Gavialis gangeticus]